MAASEQVVAWVGLDWADDQHEVRVCDAGSGEVESEQVKQSPEAIQQWVLKLRSRFVRGRVAIALEQKRGGLMAALMAYDFLQLYPVNPHTLSSFRQALYPSGKKDDPHDATLLLELVQTHHQRLRCWRPDTVQTRRLQALVEDRRHWVDQRKRFEQQLVAALKNYYPHPLQWFNPISKALALDFLSRCPSLTQAQKLTSSSLRAMLRRHRVRHVDSRLARLLEQISSSCPLTEDAALVETGALKVRALVTQLQDLVNTIADYDRRIDQAFGEHPDGALFAGFTGAGASLAPRLVAAFGTDRSRFTDARQVQQFSGIAPVTRRSGRSCVVHWRRGCPKFIRQTFHEYAACSMPHSPWARAYYLQQRGRGLGHHAAVRALAYKWIRILFRCWKDRVPYDEQFYCQRLKENNSPLFALINQSNTYGSLA